MRSIVSIFALMIGLVPAAEKPNIILIITDDPLF
jgi:hypothetical protein